MAWWVKQQEYYNKLNRREAELRKILKEKNPDKFGTMYTNYLQGINDAMGPEYARVVNDLAQAEAIQVGALDALAQIENLTSAGRIVTDSEVKKIALDSARGQGIKQVLAAFSIYGILTGQSLEPGSSAGKGASPDDLFANGAVPKASDIAKWAESQGWKAVKTETGPLKYVDENGIPRVTIKQGNARTPGSETPHVEFKGADGSRTDPFGNSTTRKGQGNHSSIDFDL
jgi:hypothetical protein